MQYFIARAATHAARVAYAKSDYASAAGFYERALATQPKDAKNWYDLAVVRAHTGNALAACTALRRALEEEVLYAGQALSDPELESIRLDVEATVLAMTDEAFAAADARAEMLRALTSRAVSIAKEIRVPIAPPADSHPLLVRAHDRATYLAAIEVCRELSKEHGALRARILSAIRTAKSRASSERTVETRRVATDRDQWERAIQAQDDELRRKDSSYNELAQMAWMVLGGILGIYVGFQIDGCFGAVGGALAGGFGGGPAYWLWWRMAGKRAQARLAAFRGKVETERQRMPTAPANKDLRSMDLERLEAEIRAVND